MRRAATMSYVVTIIQREAPNPFNPHTYDKTQLSESTAIVRRTAAIHRYV